MVRKFIYLASALTVGCGIDRSDFINEYAEAFCDWKDGCGRMGEQYGTRNECIDQAEDAAFSYAPNDDGCSFNADNAQKCIDGFESLECLDSVETINACKKISDCYNTTTDDGSEESPDEEDIEAQ